MILRRLSDDEIRLLSCRFKVNQKVVESFLRGIGGISIETAYKRLNAPYPDCPPGDPRPAASCCSRR